MRARLQFFDWCVALLRNRLACGDSAGKVTLDWSWAHGDSLRRAVCDTAGIELLRAAIRATAGS
ncbi:MAG: hypothetical protein WB626_00065 [Bacteroidota bacterium]